MRTFLSCQSHIPRISRNCWRGGRISTARSPYRLNMPSTRPVLTRREASSKTLCVNARRPFGSIRGMRRHITCKALFWKSQDEHDR
jgi:hypothetical protein